jgi:hypothetical protein
LTSFRAARSHVDGFARATIGEAAALSMLNAAPAAEAAWRRAELEHAHMDRTGRSPEALLSRACGAALRGDAGAVNADLDRFLSVVPISHLGWSIPVEPCFAALHGNERFRRVLAALAERAR